MIRFGTWRRLLGKNALILLAAWLQPRHLMAWGEPHLAITAAALEVLPAWQKKILGDDLAALAHDYCTIPDRVFTDKADAKFAQMDSSPGEVYVKKLHLPTPEQPENLETLRYFMEKAVTALKTDKVPDAARYMGTICHLLEDFGSPAHTIPGDNMFTLLQQFMPPPERLKGKLLHSLIENGDLKVSVGGYKPKLLGITVEEASWHLLHRVHEGIINARGTTFPIIQALYADNADAVRENQMKAAVVDAQVVADAVYTLLCLGAEKFEPAERDALASASIAGYFPLEAVNLYYAQTQFGSSPNWGPPQSGLIMEGGNKPTPLKLRVQEKDTVMEKTFAAGVSPVMGHPLTWLLPKGTFQRFTVLAGLHSELGEKGRVEFTIFGDDKPLASAVVNGTEPAHFFECPVAGVTRLRLAAEGRGVNSKANYTIWAEPTLLKK